jgi:fructose-1,6-bisphosphatase/inositol monophosphatase family enzyme
MTAHMQFSKNDALRIDAILAQVAATEIMPRFQTLAAHQVKQKSSNFDLVTEADEAAERVIADQLRAAFPGCIVVGEEATAKDGTLLAEIAGAELAFIVDPIDGTMNFASGLPLFGVILAATVKGEVVLSAIHEPVREDTAFALRGEGAWIQRKDGRTIDLRVAEPAPLSAMQAMVSTSFLPEPLRTVVNGNLSRIGMTSSLRCAAHEYRLVAAGHCHLLFYNKLMPWDHAAGWLLHREAGGYSAHFDGSEYKPTHLTGGLICAPDKDSWQSARDALLGDAEIPAMRV